MNKNDYIKLVQEKLKDDYFSDYGQKIYKKEHQ